MNLQFLDSQIAEFVMLELISAGITCLPVHDSFLVDRRYIKQLEQAMNRGYAKFVPGIPKMKLDTTKQYSEFQMTFKENGELDRDAMFAMHANSIHNLYVQSWYNHR